MRRRRDYVKKLRLALTQRLSRRPVLFPARRYGDPGPELRRPLADRRADPGARPGGKPGAGARAATAHGEGAGPGRRASAAGARRAGALLHDRPDARAGAWAQRRQRGEQRQYQPQLLRAGHAQFLDRSDTRHSLLSRGADAGVSDQQCQRAERDADRELSQHERAHPQCAGQCGHHASPPRAIRLQPVQHPAGLRSLCQRPEQRSRQRGHLALGDSWASSSTS